MRKGQAALLTACLLLGPPVAWADAPGSSAFEFLKLGASARQSGMGEAGVALGDEMGNAQLNPASSAGATSRQLSFSYNKIFDDVQHGEIGYAHPLLNGMTLGGDFQYLNYGTIPGADATGVKTGNVSAGDRMLRLNWASARQNSVVPGLSLKVAQETLDSVTATAVALDAGVLYRPRRNEQAGMFWSDLSNHMSFGAALRNLGPQPKFDARSESLPLALSVGAAHRSLADSLTFALDLESSMGRSEALAAHFGMEAWLKDTVALRLGVRSDQDIGLGLGWGVGVKAGSAIIDYSMRPFGALGFIHRIGVSLRFGASLADAYYEQGLHQFRARNYAEAVLLFDKALTISPNRHVIEMALEAAQALEKESPAAEPKPSPTSAGSQMPPSRP